MQAMDDTTGPMTNGEILSIVLREMTSYGAGWRRDWNDFDGRTLRDQLNGIAKWADEAQKSNTHSDYLDGTKFYEEQGQW